MASLEEPFWSGTQLTESIILGIAIDLERENVTLANVSSLFWYQNSSFLGLYLHRTQKGAMSWTKMASLISALYLLAQSIDMKLLLEYLRKFHNT